MAGPFATPIIPVDANPIRQAPEVQRMPVKQDPQQTIDNARWESIGEGLGGLFTTYADYKTNQFVNQGVSNQIDEFAQDAAEKIREADTLPEGASGTLNDLLAAQEQGKITRQQLYGQARALRNDLIAKTPYRQAQIDKMFNERLGIDPRGSEFGDLMKGSGTAGDYGNSSSGGNTQLKAEVGKRLLSAVLTDPTAAQYAIFKNPKDLGSLDVDSTFFNIMNAQRQAAVIKGADKLSEQGAQDAARAFEQQTVVASANHIISLGQVASAIDGDKVTYTDPNDPNKTITENSTDFWNKQKEQTKLKILAAQKDLDSLESQFRSTPETRASFALSRERLATQLKTLDDLKPHNAVVVAEQTKKLADQSAALKDEAHINFAKMAPQMFAINTLFPQATNEITKDIMSTGTAQVAMIKNKIAKGQELSVQDKMTMGFNDYFNTMTPDQKILSRLESNYQNLADPTQPISAVNPVNRDHVFKTQYRAIRAQYAIDPSTVPQNEINAWATSTNKVLDYTVSQGVEDYGKALAVIDNPRFTDYMNKVQDSNLKASVVDKGVKLATSSIVGANGAIPRIAKILEPIANQYPEVGKVEVNFDTGSVMYNPKPVAPSIGLGLGTINQPMADKIKQNVIAQTQMDVKKQVDQINQAVSSIESLSKYDPTLKNMSRPEILSSLLSGLTQSPGITAVGTPSKPAPQITSQQVAAASSNTPQTVDQIVAKYAIDTPQAQVGVLGSTGRPELQNADGSVSTERSITVTNQALNGGAPTNIPSIWNGRQLSEEGAIKAAIASGQKFESFKDIPSAVKAAEARSATLGKEVDQQQKLNSALKSLNQPLPDLKDVVSSLVDSAGKALIPAAQGAPIQRAVNETQDTSNGEKPTTLQIASAYLGKSEHTDAKVLSEAFKKAGMDIDPRDTAWCAAFVNTVLNQEGIKGTGSLAARSFLKYGEPTDTPTKGDIVVLTRGKDDGVHGHVGFFVGYTEDKKHVIILGGNQDKEGRVSKKEYPVERVLGYRRPPKAKDIPQILEDFNTTPPSSLESGKGQESLPFPGGQLPHPNPKKR